MRKVTIDAGHGGSDPGAVFYTEYHEKHFTLDYALLIGAVLSRHGVNVNFTRLEDKYVSLSDRCKIANSNKSELFVSIHMNSSGNMFAQGVETYSHPSSGNGAKLSRTIHDSIIKSKAYTKDRGTKTANFHVLRETSMPAALVEISFISNVEDRNLAKQKKIEIAEAIAKGILEHMGIKYIKESANNMTENKAKPHWGQARVEKLKELGIISGEHDPKSNVTWAEFSAGLLQTIDFIKCTNHSKF